jgi:hypothetical protein
MVVGADTAAGVLNIGGDKLLLLAPLKNECEMGLLNPRKNLL